MTPRRNKNRNGLTAGEAFEGAVMSSSLFTISHNAESVSVTCSRSPSKKSSIFLSTPVRVASVVERSIHTDASWLAYRLLISSYLRPVGLKSTMVMCPAHLDANLLKDSSTMSHIPSPLRIWFRARVFSAGTSYCSENTSDIVNSAHVFRG
jgi:hypothetical protein